MKALLSIFNELTPSQKWDLWKTQKGSWACGGCGKPLDGSCLPQRAIGEGVIRCGSCDAILTRRDVIGDTFNWVLVPPMRKKERVAAAQKRAEEDTTRSVVAELYGFHELKSSSRPIKAYREAPLKKIPAKMVCRIIDRRTGEAQGAYFGGSRDRFDFSSISEARNSNCHDIYKDKKRYSIAKYRVTYELVKEDCDG